MATSLREISSLRKLCRDMAPDHSLERCFHSALVVGSNEVISILQALVLQLVIMHGLSENDFLAQFSLSENPVFMTWGNASLCTKMHLKYVYQSA
jgi:hypothetical protein